MRMISNFSSIPVIPVIHLSSGRVVQWDALGRTTRRDPHANPLRLTLTWAERGVNLIHIVDLDAATGRPSTVPALMMGLRSQPVTVRLAGGIHDEIAARNRKAFGIQEIVVSTALHSTSTLQKILAVYPASQVLAGLYCRDGQLFIGRNEKPIAAELLSERMMQFGLHRMVLTSQFPESIALNHNRLLISRLAQQGFEIWVAGSVESDIDVLILSDHGVAGVLMDRAYPLIQ